MATASSSWSVDPVLKLISFNVNNFSRRKEEDSQVVEVILQIIKDYDIVILLRVENSTDTVLTKLVAQKCDGQFAKIDNGPLEQAGPCPEEYSFIYRSDHVKILDHYQSKTSELSRPPYPVFVKSIETELEFFIVPVHTKSNDAINEINALPDVFNEAAERFKTTKGVIMGTLNCGGNFVRKKQYKELTLCKKKCFRWWIEYDRNTTPPHRYTTPGHYAYDRIITHRDLTSLVVPGSAEVVEFDKMLGLTNKRTAAVSDHYPVAFSLMSYEQLTTLLKQLYDYDK